MSDACEVTKTRYDSVSYTPYPQSVRLARRRVAERVVTWGHPELAGDAALVTSELGTNALLHGCLGDRLFRVEVRLDGRVLRIAVTDPRGERLPQTRAPGVDERYGRGLVIVRTVAARWDVVPLTVGKTVWAELDVTQGPVGRSLPTGPWESPGQPPIGT
ncbi:ATP-binding protein [Streptomyces sp. NPDC015346]|uniref:ATP-binding protein n=1 Tax=Streptomyces sp. NPDC015346 TaxID=3364954 RepID=UPI0037011F9C